MSRLRIHVGCSGFSYRDWRGTFYPPNIEQSQMIAYYERFFDVLEINYTFYSQPHPHTVESFLTRTRRLRFAVKVNRVFTHEREYTGRDLTLFLKGCEPLISEEHRFIAFLFQFPQSFRLSPESMEYLRKLSADFAGFEKAVEFRSRSFGSVEVLEEVQELGFSIVNVDAPKLRGLLVGPWLSLGALNYVRLHGRNAEKWHSGEESYERYDYLYSREELEELKEKILRIHSGKDTFVFFNNHCRGKGALNALQMKALFGEDVQIPKSLSHLAAKRLWE